MWNYSAQRQAVRSTERYSEHHLAVPTETATAWFDQKGRGVWQLGEENEAFGPVGPTSSQLNSNGPKRSAD